MEKDKDEEDDNGKDKVIYGCNSDAESGIGSQDLSLVGIPTDTPSDCHQQIPDNKSLRGFYRLFIKEIEPLDIVNHLRENDILSETEDQEIQKEHIRSKRARKLIDILLKNMKDDTMMHVITALTRVKNFHVVEMLQRKQKEKADFLCNTCGNAASKKALKALKSGVPALPIDTISMILFEDGTFELTDMETVLEANTYKQKRKLLKQKLEKVTDKGSQFFRAISLSVKESGSSVLQEVLDKQVKKVTAEKCKRCAESWERIKMSLPDQRKGSVHGEEDRYMLVKFSSNPTEEKMKLIHETLTKLDFVKDTSFGSIVILVDCSRLRIRDEDLSGEKVPGIILKKLHGLEDKRSREIHLEGTETVLWKKSDKKEILVWQNAIVHNIFTVLEELDVFQYSSLFSDEEMTEIVRERRDRRARVRALIHIVLYREPQKMECFVTMLQHGNNKYVFELLCDFIKKHSKENPPELKDCAITEMIESSVSKMSSPVPKRKKELTIPMKDNPALIPLEENSSHRNSDKIRASSIKVRSCNDTDVNETQNNEGIAEENQTQLPDHRLQKENSELKKDVNETQNNEGIAEENQTQLPDHRLQKEKSELKKDDDISTFRKERNSEQKNVSQGKQNEENGGCLSCIKFILCRSPKQFQVTTDQYDLTKGKTQDNQDVRRRGIIAESNIQTNPMKFLSTTPTCYTITPGQTH